MNPAVLKALVEALKQGGKFLGSATGVSGVAGRGAGLAGRATRTFDPRKSPLKEGPRPQGNQTWRGETRTEIPYRGPGQGVPKDPAHGARYRGKFPNWLSGGTLGADLTKLGLTTAGAGTGLGLLFGGKDEQTQQTNPVVSALLGKTEPEWQPDPNIASRVQFQKNTQAKFNRQMKKLLLNYGIVNLINPDSAKDMLEIGMAILEQNITASGDTRQAKIFDSVFKSGSMPKTARAAAERILKAGGTNADVKDITGIYADSAPKAPDYSKEESNVMMLSTVRALLDAGQDAKAKELILTYIMSGFLDRDKLPQGTNMSPDDQADAWLEIINGAPVGTGDSGGIQISSRTTG